MSDSLEVPLRRVSTIIMGQSPPSDTYNSDGWGLPFLQGNADFGRKTPSPTTYSTAPRKVSNPGDVLLSVRAPVGQLNVSDQSYGLGRGLCAVRFRPGLADPALGWYAMLVSAWRLQQVATGSTYDSVDYQDVASVQIPVIDRAKQATVADFLDRETAHIDRLIEKKERLITLLEEKRSALITRAVTKGLDPDVPMKDSGVEWIGEIPEHWEVCPMRHLSASVTSGSRGWATHYADQGAVFLRIGNVSTTGISLDLSEVVHVDAPDSLEARRTRTRPGDVLLSITALIGASAIVPEGFPEAYVNQHLALIRPRLDRAEPEWLSLFLQSGRGRAQLRVFTYGGTKEGLSLDDVRSIGVPMPPVREQKMIVGSLKRSWKEGDSVIGTTHQSISLLRERRSALITAAVTGQIDVEQYGRSYRAPLAPNGEDLEPPVSATATPD